MIYRLFRQFTKIQGREFSKVKMVSLIFDFYGVWGEIHDYVIAISLEEIFPYDY